MALTPETFQNLERDIDDTGKTPNTDAVIIPRYGSPYKSLPMVSREGEEKFNTAVNDFKTRYYALSLRGDWEPSTHYQVKDLVFVNNITYICLIDHTSSSNFQNDVNAGKWIVYQGVTQVDLQSYVAMNKTYAPVLGSPVKFKLNPLMASFLYGISDPTHKDDDLNNFRGLNNPDAYHDSNVAIGAVSFGRNNPPFAYLSLAGGHDCVPFGVASFVLGAGS
ncbi:carbohydrate-binding protein, partial [Acinetobacter baumannii]